MKENLRIFDFVLSEEDMNRIVSLDRSESLFFSHTSPQMVEWFDGIVKARRENQDHRKEVKKW